LKWPKKLNPRASQGSSLALPPIPVSLRLKQHVDGRSHPWVVMKAKQNSVGEASGQRKAATADEAQSAKST
jgi:hypothetical protein